MGVTSAMASGGARVEDLLFTFPSGASLPLFDSFREPTKDGDCWVVLLSPCFLGIPQLQP